MLPEEFPGIEETVYAGFWRRFGSFWLDFLIMAPWIVFISFVNNAGRLNYFYTLVPSYIVVFFFHIYCVKRWGGTPGKLIAKIKIVKVSGKPVGWREAILRHIVYFLIGLPVNIAFIVVLLKMTDEQYSSIGYMERVRWMVDNMPFWYKPSQWAQNIWMWSEFIVLLCNKRKRALHDFVAGTVVIKKKYEQEAEAWEK